MVEWRESGGGGRNILKIHEQKLMMIEDNCFKLMFSILHTIHTYNAYYDNKIKNCIKEFVLLY